MQREMPEASALVLRGRSPAISRTRPGPRLGLAARSAVQGRAGQGGGLRMHTTRTRHVARRRGEGGPGLGSGGCTPPAGLAVLSGRCGVPHAAGESQRGRPGCRGAAGAGAAEAGAWASEAGSGQRAAGSEQRAASSEQRGVGGSGRRSGQGAAVISSQLADRRKVLALARFDSSAARSLAVCPPAPGTLRRAAAGAHQSPAGTSPPNSRAAEPSTTVRALQLKLQPWGRRRQRVCPPSSPRRRRCQRAATRPLPVRRWPAATSTTSTCTASTASTCPSTTTRASCFTLHASRFTLHASCFTDERHAPLPASSAVLRRPSQLRPGPLAARAARSIAHVINDFQRELARRDAPARTARGLCSLR
ncbi:hypothetical protein SVAN01_03745 [Stagonosporopsis vannaccii]|nr:hypothetical protein SVAN01_03745 [Stagonosporopsis vannaccii]